MTPDLTPITEQLKILYNSAIPLLKALSNLVVLVLEAVIRLVKEGVARL